MSERCEEKKDWKEAEEKNAARAWARRRSEAEEAGSGRSHDEGGLR